MKPNHWSGLLLGTILAALGSTAMGQSDPHWKPDKASRIAFSALDAALDDAESVVYLNASCRVMAVLVPSDDVIDKYVPTGKKIGRSWMDRREFTSLACATNPAFLDTTWVSGTNANACKPGVLLPAADLAGVTCEIDPSDVKALIVLNPAHDPIVIIEGASAQRFAKRRFPAEHLARNRFSPACTPAIPAPCLPPRSGVIKIVNGGQMCVCQ